MKRLIFILIGSFIAVSIVSIFIKPTIIFLAKKQLTKVFIDSTVTVKNCNLRPLSLLSLSDIEIKKEQAYNIKIKEVGIEYTPLSIIKGNILKFSLKEAQATIDLGKKSLLGFSKLLNLNTGKSPFLINSLELTNLILNIKSQELTLDARVSSELNLIQQLVNSLDLKINSLHVEGLELKNASLKAAQLSPSGSLYIEEIKYDKLKIEKIASSVRLKDKNLYLDSLSASLFTGKIKGSANLLIDKLPEYLVNLEFSGIDLNAFVNDFKLNEKVDLSGRMDGVTTLKGKGLNFTVLSGDFTTNAPGGDLTIKDKSYLENIARGSGQTLDILVENFKNYHYNKGVMNLSLKEGSLILDIALEGEAGKRNFTVNMHNFNLGR